MRPNRVYSYFAALNVALFLYHVLMSVISLIIIHLMSVISYAIVVDSAFFRQFVLHSYFWVKLIQFKIHHDTVYFAFVNYLF